MRRRLVTCGVLVLLVLACGRAATAPAAEWGERPNGGYYRVVDLDGNFITETAWDVAKGDLYISESNKRYIVDHIVEDTVYARYDGKEKMPIIYDKKSGTASFLQWAAQLGGGNKDNKKLVAIYSTHSDESYRPTSGVDSKTRGDIYQVSRTLANGLQNEGYKVDYSSAEFLPHDGQAYVRSRRVAAQFAKQMPQTIIDVHRDAIPDPSSYLTTVNGVPMSKVRIVVGRQNQNRDANLAYAKRIKAVADQKYPGLIKGIFHAHGNYNQDLGPKTILLEFGTNTTSLNNAQKSAQLMAKVIPAAAGMAPGTGGSANSQIGSAAMNTVWWILGIALVGVLGYFLLNREGFGRKTGASDAQAGGALGALEEPDTEADDPDANLSAGAIGVHRKRRIRRFGRRRK